MGLDFDITSTPPDTASIAAVRAELEAERQRLREINKRFLMVIIPLVLSLLSFMLIVVVPAVSQPNIEGTLVFLAAYTLPYFFFTIFVVGNTMHHNKVDVPQKALRIAEASLEEVSQEEIEELADACQTHATLGAYQSQVETQGRALFKGELEAMRLWLEEHAGK